MDLDINIIPLIAFILGLFAKAELSSRNEPYNLYYA